MASLHCLYSGEAKGVLDLDSQGESFHFHIPLLPQGRGLEGGRSCERVEPVGTKKAQVGPSASPGGGFRPACDPLAEWLPLCLWMTFSDRVFEPGPTGFLCSCLPCACATTSCPPSLCTATPTCTVRSLLSPDCCSPPSALLGMPLPWMTEDRQRRSWSPCAEDSCGNGRTLFDAHSLPAFCWVHRAQEGHGAETVVHREVLDPMF